MGWLERCRVGMHQVEQFDELAGLAAVCLGLGNASAS